MKERPILFSAPMVRAILAGTKTQTRRVAKGVKHFPEWGSAVGMVGGAWRYGSSAGLGLSDRGDHWAVSLDEDYLRRMCTSEAYGWGAGAGCPYGQPGGRLWLREAWRAPLAYDLTPPRDIPPGTPIVYQADGAGSLPHFNAGKLRPPMFMPRWASRITLEITGVRVERLQDISEADAQAEGVYTDPACPAYDAYRVLWEQINGPGSWDENPWVWVVEFKRLEGNAS